MEKKKNKNKSNNPKAALSNSSTVSFTSLGAEQPHIKTKPTGYVYLPFKRSNMILFTMVY